MNWRATRRAILGNFRVEEREMETAIKEGRIMTVYTENNGTSYAHGTHSKVIAELERARAQCLRVYFRLGDVSTGRDWLEENDLCGYVGRSTGGAKVPLLLGKTRSSGGDAILTDCILLLFVDGKEVYRHSLYQVPQFQIVDSKMISHPIGIQAIGGKVVANFKTMYQAERWVSFMTGHRMSK
jgi:hypothetical protein